MARNNRTPKNAPATNVEGQEPQAQAPQAQDNPQDNPQAQPPQDAQAQAPQAQDSAQTPPQDNAGGQTQGNPQDAQPASKEGKILYKLAAGNHALSGEKLYAHTVAVLELSGAFEGKDVALWRSLVGPSALAYHKAKGNVETGPTGAPRLTEKGKTHFAARKIAAALRDSYRTALTTGEIPVELAPKGMTRI